MNRPQLVEEALPPEDLLGADKGRLLPDPVGYKILCALPEFDAKFAGTNLVRPDAIIDQERLATVVLFVLKLGPDCYKDEKRYPFGPWCKKGDFILTRQYSGTRLSIYGKEFRIISDDQVEAVVSDPRGISRA